ALFPLANVFFDLRVALVGDRLAHVADVVRAACEHHEARTFPANLVAKVGVREVLGIVLALSDDLRETLKRLVATDTTERHRDLPQVAVIVVRVFAATQRAGSGRVADLTE